MGTLELDRPKPNAVEGRRGEGLLVLEQDNDQRIVKITKINETLEVLLGYGHGELLGQSVGVVLGKQSTELLSDDLEYLEDAPDFGDIFSRIREVKLKRRLGDEIKIECTLTRLMSEGRNACFQIVVPNEIERISSDKFEQFIQLNLEGRKELDPKTGLPNRETARAFLPMLKNFYLEHPANVAFATLRLDRFDKSIKRYGEDACVQLLMHAAQSCRSTFRSKDIIFALSDHTLGVVLFDISRESARVVFNRLRWRIRNHRFAFGGKADFSISACIGFDMLDLERIEEIFDRCEQEMDKLDANERNALIELGNG